MIGVFPLALALVLSPALSAATSAPSARPPQNMVSKFLGQVLESVSQGLSEGNLTVGALELGEEVGRLGGVEVGAVGGMRTEVNGSGSWGVRMVARARGVVVGGEYDLVHLDVPMLFPFFGKGDFLIFVEEVSFKLSLDAKYDFSKDSFSFTIPHVEIAALESKVYFENLMNDPYLADFLNELISNLVPDLVKMLNEPLPLVLEPVMNVYGNGVFLCIKNELLGGDVVRCIEDLFKKSADRSLWARVVAQLLPRILR